MTSVTFEGIKYSYNQRQAGIVIAFVVHPENMPDYVALAPLGSRVMITLTEIGDDERAVEPKAEKPHRRFDDMPKSQQSALLCGDKEFQEFLLVDNAEQAARRVREYCDVESRAELDSRAGPAAEWDKLRAQFNQKYGRSAEARG